MARKGGPKPQPNTLKVARGTHRADRHGALEDEVRPPVANELPAAPDTLGTEGKRRWQQIGSKLLPLGLLTDSDIQSLEQLCMAYEEQTEAMATIKKDGRYQTSEKGHRSAHPAVGTLRDAKADIRRYLVEFGMTPSARVGLSVKPKADANKVSKRERKA